MQTRSRGNVQAAPTDDRHGLPDHVSMVAMVQIYGQLKHYKLENLCAPFRIFHQFSDDIPASNQIHRVFTEGKVPDVLDDAVLPPVPGTVPTIAAVPINEDVEMAPGTSTAVPMDDAQPSTSTSMLPPSTFGGYRSQRGAVRRPTQRSHYSQRPSPVAGCSRWESLSSHRSAASTQSTVESTSASSLTVPPVGVNAGSGVGTVAGGDSQAQSDADVMAGLFFPRQFILEDTSASTNDVSVVSTSTSSSTVPPVGADSSSAVGTVADVNSEGVGQQQSDADVMAGLFFPRQFILEDTSANQVTSSYTGSSEHAGVSSVTTRSMSDAVPSGQRGGPRAPVAAPRPTSPVDYMDYDDRDSYFYQHGIPPSYTVSVNSPSAALASSESSTVEKSPEEQQPDPAPIARFGRDVEVLAPPLKKGYGNLKNIGARVKDFLRGGSDSDSGSIPLKKEPMKMKKKKKKKTFWGRKKKSKQTTPTPSSSVAAMESDTSVPSTVGTARGGELDLERSDLDGRLEARSGPRIAFAPRVSQSISEPRIDEVNLNMTAEMAEMEEEGRRLEELQVEDAVVAPAVNRVTRKRRAAGEQNILADYNGPPAKTGVILQPMFVCPAPNCQQPYKTARGLRQHMVMSMLPGHDARVHICSKIECRRMCPNHLVLAGHRCGAQRHEEV